MIRPFGFDEVLFLLQSTGWTVVLTIAASTIGGALGLCIALARVAANPVMRELARAYIAIVQGIPVLMVLFLSYYGLSQAGLELPPVVAASMALSVYSSAYLGDIWRGAIQSVPRQQWEASASLALTKGQQYRHIILPQSIKIALPPTVGFLVQLVKNTSIVSIVSVVELTRAGQLVNNVTFEPFRVFIVVALIYLAICYPMSRASRRLEEKFRVYRDH
ncbi:amino acid ABC transporter permease [Paralcaligenes ureilyticus]|jgi:polar amino acid transport system permease protein|uniref:Amino acid ABC transporter membrane protein 2 (PAAT family) n=1 Tax=Paralcaligenes ureilyticus TaxID=627131 RepID=A0A4V2UXR2_9BURK|nr:amino acid ABC transporter permease [Paralcaligenes ureilyticus]TCT04468.1 amino acid ABC transporter membrane protein 2 (PAAT family) [Paralcaligenes ureilyticus]